MTKWLWYFGWLIGWFVLFSFVFVPIPNPLLRGLTLTLAWVLLFYGFRFINRRFRAEEVDQSVRDGSLGAAGSGISEREAAFIAAAREPTLSTGATQSISDGPHAATSLRTASDVERHSIHQVTVVGGVMKSAGNPLVRRAFAQAMKEVETKTYDTGLWAMALVECNGDERLARLAYMKARAADIAWADAKTAESAQQTRNAK